MDAVHTKTCRVGVVEGPFLTTTKWGDGTPKTGSDRPKKRVRYWVVRWMDGTIVRDTHFASKALADAYYDSLPPWNG